MSHAPMNPEHVRLWLLAGLAAYWAVVLGLIAFFAD